MPARAATAIPAAAQSLVGRPDPRRALLFSRVTVPAMPPPPGSARFARRGGGQRLAEVLASLADGTETVGRAVLGAQPVVQQPGAGRTGQRRQPEQPELRQRP